MKQVTAAVIVEDGLILLARRPQGDPLAGLWELPGGKVEPGESLKQCLERELKEELDMNSEVGVIAARTVYHYAHGSFEMIALHARRLSEYTALVHDQVAWVSRSALDRYPLAPADVELVRELEW